MPDRDMGKSLFDWPFKVYDAAMKSPLAHLESFCPDGQGQRLSPEGQKPNSARVRVLNRTGRPSHIPRLVSLFVINAVDAVLGTWTRADVGKKGMERILPFLANGYPPPPVILEATASRVSAPTYHGYPYPMLWKVGHRLGFSFCRRLGRPFRF